MASYFGLKELQAYIASNHKPEFDPFIEGNTNNIVIWSVSTNCNSVDDRFQCGKADIKKHGILIRKRERQHVQGIHSI
jgi:hypothetical protein